MKLKIPRFHGFRSKEKGQGLRCTDNGRDGGGR